MEPPSPQGESLVVLIFDDQGRIIDVRGASEALLGGPPESLLGESPERFGDDIAGVMREVFAEVQDVRAEDALLTTYPGERRPVRVTALRFASSRSRAIAVIRPTAVIERVARLDDLFDRVTDGVVVYDHDWRFVYLNRSAQQYYGRPREELLGRVVWSVFPASVGTEAERVLREASARREPTEVELLAPEFKRWVALRVFPSDAGVAVLFRDVTEHKEKDDALRESEARFRAITEHAMDGIMLTLPSGEIRMANPAACRMLGRTEEEICAVGRAGIVLPDARVAALLEERDRTGHARGEIGMLRRDGTAFPVAVTSAAFVDVAGKPSTSLSFRDLTEQKRSEDRLRLVADAGIVLGRSLETDSTLRDLTRLIVPKMADYCLVDLLSQGALRRVAASHEDPETERALRAFSPGPLEDRTAGLFRVARTGEPELVPVVDDAWLRATTRDQAHFELVHRIAPRSVIVVPLLARGRVLGVLTLASVDAGRRYGPADLEVACAIGDRAGLAIDNAHLHEEMTRAKKLGEEMLGVVSHDLRGPLNAVMLNAQVLARKQAAPELESIVKAVRRADLLIHDLLSAAVADANAMQLARREEEVGALVQEAVDLARPAATEASVVIETLVADAMPPVLLDRHRVLQVLSNLLDNAVKFSPAGGHVRVRAGARDDAVIVSVSDEGPGVPRDLRSRIFERFRQGPLRRSGAGLGLSIAKGIVEAHGGSIRVESVPGEGATFVFSLPLRST